MGEAVPDLRDWFGAYEVLRVRIIPAFPLAWLGWRLGAEVDRRQRTLTDRFRHVHLPAHHERVRTISSSLADAILTVFIGRSTGSSTRLSRTHLARLTLMKR